jgi:hypothetical protein
MTEERSTHPEEQEKKPRPWRPTYRQVFWAIGMGVTLMTIALLVVQLYPGLWEDLSREPVAMLKGRVATLIGIGVALTVLMVLLAKGSAALGWTGFRGKTLWDLLQLLVVPLVLVGIGFLFEMRQAERQEALELQQQALEDRRAKAERALAEERAQDEALQAYLDEIGALLLAKYGLRESEEGTEVRTLARARTITVLGRLDPSHKTALMQFLVEAELVQRVDGRGPIIGLAGADLSDAYLYYADLRGANLDGANLNKANLRRANLRGANLSEADLRGANLSEANLSGANLFYADLSDANLRVAELSGANLSGANLSSANLISANGKTNEQLEQQDGSLEGTIMPDGTLYPGRYAAREFEPALSFSVSDGWQLPSASHRLRPPLLETTDELVFVGEPVLVDTTDELFIVGPEGGALSFTHPRYVYDPSNPSEPKEVPAPENADEWASWFQSHPNLELSDEPVPVSVGGASGMRIDVTTSSTPENYPRKFCREEPCVPLYPLSNESGYGSFEGHKDRFVIVDVGGETVLIDVSATTDKFDEFLPKAQKVLDSVEWKGG